VGATDCGKAMQYFAPASIAQGEVEQMNIKSFDEHVAIK
jgi:hypothetical protein